MPRHTEQESRNIAVTERRFDTANPVDESLLFAEDAAWWNGLPLIGGKGDTEHWNT